MQQLRDTADQDLSNNVMLYLFIYLLIYFFSLVKICPPLFLVQCPSTC